MLTLIAAGLMSIARMPDNLIALGGQPARTPEGVGARETAMRARVRQNIEGYFRRYGGRERASLGAASEERIKYPFFPQAGNLWQDLFVLNFVDQDPSDGAIDWDCTDFTYDGHQGHDSRLKTFTEQEIGVPVFAVLDGVCVDRYDGTPDHNTDWSDQPENYVVLWHGGSQYTMYWHLKTWSVIPHVNQRVRSGEQIGQTGSSGISSGPHLDFESWFEDESFEPSSGQCRPGESNWETQTAIRRDVFSTDFNLTNKEIETYPALPYDIPRSGYVRKGQSNLSWWIQVHNQPANSTWRIRIKRPDGSTKYDYGPYNFGNAEPYRSISWWWRWGLTFEVTGDWTVEAFISGVSMGKVPFRVVDAGVSFANRPPYRPNGKLDPPQPKNSQAAFCRIDNPGVLDDPDYDVVRYRYRWYANNVLIRDVTSAALSDAVPARSKDDGSSIHLRCIVDVSDGKTSYRAFSVENSSGRERMP